MIFKKYFIEKQGEKEVLKKSNISILIFIFLVLVIGIELYSGYSEHGKLNTSSTPFTERIERQKQANVSLSTRIKDIVKPDIVVKKVHKRRKVKTVIPIKYSAKQVISRNKKGRKINLPTGTNLLAELIGGIDTRHSKQIVLASLRNKIRHKNGSTIPAGSRFRGSFSYNKDQEKVYLKFSKIIFPDGEEYSISAHVLDFSDYSVGLYGNYHDYSGLKIAANMGLSLVSTAADVLTKKKVDYSNPYSQPMEVPEANFESAGLQGLSRIANEEAQRVNQKLQARDTYLTVESGRELIISLTSTFKGLKEDE